MFVEKTIYETPVYRIGKNHWKLQVYVNQYYGNCTRYLWQRADSDDPRHWKTSHQWPKYDGNDTYDGLPRSLEKIYNRHQLEIKNSLRGTNETKPQQVMEFA
jgi:hypothetical protein